MKRTAKELQVLQWSNLIELGNLSSPEHVAATVQDEDVLSLTYSDESPWPSVNKDLSVLLRSRRIRIRRVSNDAGHTYIVYIIPQDLPGFESQVLPSAKILNSSGKAVTLALKHLLSSLHIDGQPVSHQDLSMHSLMDAWKSAIQPQLVKEEQHARLPHRSGYVADIIRDVERETGQLEEMLVVTLMQYQRGTVAQMIYRENQADQLPDVTLSPFEGKDGKTFYMDSAQRVRSKRATYSAPLGGILADLPGSGKSLVCLALMAATKGIHAQLPTDSTLGHTLSIYLESDHPDDQHRIRKTLVPTLLECCTRKAALHSAHLARYKTEGDSPKNLVIDSLKRMRLCYNRPDENERKAFLNSISDGGRPSRHGGGYKYHSISDIPTTRIRLSKTSLFVVPDTLLGSGVGAAGQWEAELKKHFSRVGGRPATVEQEEHPAHVRYLVIRGSTSKDRVPQEDILAEFDIVIMAQSRFSHMKANSPLLRIHFVRLVVDEGHFVASNNSNKSRLAAQIHAQARWVISATPTTNLNHTEKISGSDRVLWPPTGLGYLGLNDVAESDLGKLGRIAAFLRMVPFCEDEKVFKECITDGFLNGFGFKKLAKFMKQIVIRNDPVAIKEQMDLPPLDYQVVTLPWSLLPRLSMNALLAIFLYNAISSEEEDKDFLFAKKNSKYRDELFFNLREAHVFLGRAEFLVWVEGAKEGLQKELDDIDQSRRDGLPSKYDAKKEIKLREIGYHLDMALSNPQWKAAVRSQDIPLMVFDAPGYIRHLWSIGHLAGQSYNEPESNEPMLIFADTVGRLRYEVKAMRQNGEEELDAQGIVQRFADLGLKHANDFSAEERLDPIINARLPFKTSRGSTSGRSSKGRAVIPDVVKRVQKRAQAKQDQAEPLWELPTSVLAEIQPAQITATASSLINWIINEIKYAPHDRFIIFAASPYTRYEIGWTLTLAQISCFQRSPHLHALEYSRFQKGERQVLVMDPEQGGRGLDLRGANRIIMVEPIFKEDLELQAMMRSHRLGQTRKVTVQVLVMKDSFHAEYLPTRAEISAASGNEVQSSASEDKTLLTKLKRLTFIPTPEDEDLSCAAGVFQALKKHAFSQTYDLLTCLTGSDVEDNFENQLYPTELRTDEEIEAMHRSEEAATAAEQEEEEEESGQSFTGSMRRSFVKEEPLDDLNPSTSDYSPTHSRDPFDTPTCRSSSPLTDMDDMKVDVELVDTAATLVHFSGQPSAGESVPATSSRTGLSYGFGLGKKAGRPKKEAKAEVPTISSSPPSALSKSATAKKRKAPNVPHDTVKRRKQKKQVAFADPQ